MAWDDPSVDWTSFDVVLISSTWDSVDRPKEYLAWVHRAAAATALVNPANVVAWNLDKRYLRDLDAAGLPIVPTTWVAPGESIPALPSGRDVVVKPAVSAGGRSTAWHSAAAADAARAHVTAIQDAGATAMVQERVATVDTVGELKAVYVNGTHSHASRVGGLLGRDEAILERPWEREVAVATVAASPDERAVGDAVMQELARRFGEPPAYARVDLVIDAAGAPRILEVELIDPMLRLEAGPGAADRLAAGVLARGRRQRG